MRIRIWTFIFFIGGCTVGTSAQIFPPELLCLRGDTLIWELPVNNCGPFDSYDIFFSDDPDGPYTLLASITDPAQTTYVHPNPTNAMWYYYMVSDYDCPGQPQLSSDTLDNRLPEVAVLEYVTVVGEDIELSWVESSSPEVYAYIVYRLIAGNVDIIDTVFTGTTYVDDGADPLNQSELYYVLALDPCGNTSIFLNPHSTLYLSSELDPCTRTVSLQWNRYRNWPNGIGSQEVWVGIDGAAPELAATVSPTDSSYTYDIPVDEAEYCFFLKAVEAGTGASSNSNVICLTADIVQPPDELAAVNATVTSSQEVELQWVWNTDAEINQAGIWRQQTGETAFQSVDNLPLTPPLDFDNAYQDATAQPGDGPVAYYVTTTDACGEVVQSNSVATLHLQGSALPDLSNQLSWMPPDLGDAVIDNYRLYRITPLGSQLIATLSPTELNYTDPVDVENELESFICYYAVAESTLTLSSGEVRSIETRSNTACIEQPAEVFVPNAFNPFGVNQLFKPVIRFGQGAEYELLVFNRYGQLLFQTNDPDDGWDGRYEGQNQSQGAYVYRLRLQQANGRVVEKSGVVVLLR